MSEDLRERAHDLDVTVWVGRGGIDPVIDELRSQLDESDLVKVRFLQAARGVSTTEDLADRLAEHADAEVVETRGHTGVFA